MQGPTGEITQSQFTTHKVVELGVVRNPTCIPTAENFLPDILRELRPFSQLAVPSPHRHVRPQRRITHAPPILICPVIDPHKQKSPKQVIHHLRSTPDSGSIQGTVVRGGPVHELATQKVNPLDQAVQNLIVNSVKYSNGSKWLRVSAADGDGNVRISVEDRGIGIAPADLKHIFEPFYRAKSVVDEQIHGNGLGLSIVKRTVEAHGGKVKAVSEPGKGSKFTIELPAKA